MVPEIMQGNKGDRHKAQTFGISGRRKGWDDFRETSTEAYVLL